MLVQHYHKLYIEQKKLHFIWDVETGLDSLLVDQKKIAAVVNNLLQNAIKFSQPRDQVAINISSEGDKVLFEVIDQGAGISTEKIDKIFSTPKVNGVHSTKKVPDWAYGLCTYSPRCTEVRLRCKVKWGKVRYLVSAFRRIQKLVD